MGTTSTHRIGDTAVVLGASMAGLCAARVLADRFDHVVVVDRDELPADTHARGQVPQGRHPHLLLVAGARLLEAWFPGLTAQLEADGALTIDLAADFYWHQAGGEMRRPTSDLHGPVMSRPLLERTIRRRVEALPNVTVHSSTEATGLDHDPEQRRVTGVRLRDCTTVPSALVVDATGRQARSLSWLEPLGYAPPKVSTVNVDTRYVTRCYRRTDQPSRNWQAAAIIDAPSTLRLSMALPIEGDRWLVLFGGLNGEAPPVDEPQRIAYARSLPSPVIADIIETSEPLGDVTTHRFPANQRRHIERLRRFPLGWIPLGDAVCSFDPIYGQGMTSAAMQAEALGACLDRTGGVNRRFARRYFKAAAKVVAVPWSIAVGGDFAYPDTTGKKPAGTDLLNRYMERINLAAQHDDLVALRFNEVAALVRRPESLLAPRFFLRVRRAAKRGPAGHPLAVSPSV
jgi:2-polyprenyl-6-methoxyphenol hydroxylase-like FAD-dependent oxidoreductase